MHVEVGEQVRFAVLATPLVGVTFLSKFTVPPLGEQGIDLSLLFLLAALLVGSVGGCVRFEPRRLALYVMLMGTLGVMQMLQPDLFSYSSMLLLVALHLPYVFSVPHARRWRAHRQILPCDRHHLCMLRHGAIRPSIRRQRALSVPHREFCSRRFHRPALQQAGGSGVRLGGVPCQRSLPARAFVLQSSARRWHRCRALYARQGDAARTLQYRIDRFVFRHRNAGAGDLPAGVPRHAASLGSAAARRIRIGADGAAAGAPSRDPPAVENQRVGLGKLQRLRPIRRRIRAFRPIPVERPVAHVVRLWRRCVFNLRRACPLCRRRNGAVQDRVRIRTHRGPGVLRFSVLLPAHFQGATVAHTRGGDHLFVERDVHAVCAWIGSGAAPVELGAGGYSAAGRQRGLCRRLRPSRRRQHDDRAVNSRDCVLAHGVSSVHHLSMVADPHSSVAPSQTSCLGSHSDRATELRGVCLRVQRGARDRAKNREPAAVARTRAGSGDSRLRGRRERSDRRNSA